MAIWQAFPYLAFSFDLSLIFNTLFSMSLFIGVDVGSTSARAALFTENGELLSHASSPISVWNPRPDFYEHSSEDIWTVHSHILDD